MYVKVLENVTAYIEFFKVSCKQYKEVVVLTTELVDEKGVFGLVSAPSLGAGSSETLKMTLINKVVT